MGLVNSIKPTPPLREPVGMREVALFMELVNNKETWNRHVKEVAEIQRDVNAKIVQLNELINSANVAIQEANSLEKQNARERVQIATERAELNEKTAAFETSCEQAKKELTATRVKLNEKQTALDATAKQLREQKTKLTKETNALDKQREELEARTKRVEERENKVNEAYIRLRDAGVNV